MSILLTLLAVVMPTIPWSRVHELKELVNACISVFRKSKYLD
jgi:hypothetical protein